MSNDEIKRQLGHDLAKGTENRFKSAMQSQNAVNPIGLANTFVKWAQGKDTDTVRNDPALRLLTYQIAYLMGVADSFDYNALYDECEKRSEE